MNEQDRMIMVFDFETTGLPKDGNARYNPGYSNPVDWPHSVQMAYILYDTMTNKAKIASEVIRLPEGVEVTEESEEIHKISAAYTRGRTKMGKDGSLTHHPFIKTVLKEFIQDFRRADIVVAHNIHFDRNMVLAELDRQGQECIADLKEFFENKKEFCTGIKGKYVCKMERKDKHGRTYYKMPKLKELYENLFGQVPDESKLHNALVDVVICLRCFYKMRYNKDLAEEPGLDSEIKSVIDTLSNKTTTRKSARLLSKSAVNYNGLQGL